MITPDQSREARRLLGWSQFRLAQLAELPLPSVAAFEFGAETGREVPIIICTALEAAGVKFTNGDAPGVRMRPEP